jgi:hypothetical protein
VQVVGDEHDGQALLAQAPHEVEDLPVCATPSAAVGSSRITTFEFHMTALATATDCAGRRRGPATVWRTLRMVVTDRSASVFLARDSIFGSSSRRRPSTISRPRNMFWTTSRLSASARSW